ncbi:MAG: hypothetical protein IPM53_07625 [Anaerolineaceae bacterium]|nr:hypothetical protein [Anaerolineaceae bacterium]
MMIRSRFLFLLLLLAYVGLTPAGIYTCACFVPGEPVLQEQDALDHPTGQVSSGHTAVSTLLTYLSLSFLTAAGLSLVTWYSCCRARVRPFHQPAEFVDPPLTPPPHFA